jgi:DNA-binding transcriptional ArsR family regulator
MKNTSTTAPTDCTPMKQLPEGALTEIAAYFQVLAEPTRLQILNILRTGERNVGELAQMCGFTAANVSRHLALMTQQGLVERESRGTSAYYKIADPAIFALCDLVCGSITRQLDRAAERRTAFTPQV